jgi:hypothetical protein
MYYNILFAIMLVNNSLVNRNSFYIIMQKK